MFFPEVFSACSLAPLGCLLSFRDATVETLQHLEESELRRARAQKKRVANDLAADEIKNNGSSKLNEFKQN